MDRGTAYMENAVPKFKVKLLKNNSGVSKESSTKASE